jgi:Fur family ferric uptake transcriptional regulator
MARTPRIATAITELLAGNERHAWTLEEIRDSLVRGGTKTDFSSIFRASEKLIADGAIKKLSLEDGRACFEQAAAHHDHLHCTDCDRLVAIPCVIPRKALTAIEARAGVTISEHQVTLIGLCPTCRIAAEKRQPRTTRSRVRRGASS